MAISLVGHTRASKNSTTSIPAYVLMMLTTDGVAAALETNNIYDDSAHCHNARDTKLNSPCGVDL